MQQKFDLGFVTQDVRVIQRCKSICDSFGYSYRHFNSPDDFVPEQIEYRVILIAGVPFPNGGEFSAFLTTIRTQLPDTFILYSEDNKSVENSIEIAKKFGCNLTLSSEEFYQTSKPEFICSQVIRATYLPIKSNDILANRPITFDLFHLMPQRQKFLKFCFAGDEIDTKKLEKIKSVDEVYIHRDQADRFASYIISHVDNTEEGLNRRCRSQFLALYASYTNLVFQLTDQSEKGSFKMGEDLLKKTLDLSNGLLATLATHPNPWNIINKATIGDFGSVERAPAVAAYAGIVGLSLGLPELEHLMLGALISELGLLFLPKEITELLRQDSLHKLTDEQKALFNQYPLKSIAIVLDRRIQVVERLRNIIMCCHERADKTGFPGKRFGKHIPIEAYAVHFAYELDRRTTVRMGQPRVDLEDAILQFLTEEADAPAHFTLQFILKVKVALKLKIARTAFSE